MIDGAIVPAVELNSRNKRRAFVREAESVVEKLEVVNASFYFSIFDEHDSRSYADIYKHFHELWTETIESIRKSQKFRTIMIDVTWFSNNYKPQL